MTLDRRTALTIIAGASTAPFLARTSGGSDASWGLTTPGKHEHRRQDEGGAPITGRLLSGLEAIDASVSTVMAAHGVPGAALAIAVGGRLVVARGYGFAQVQARVPMRPETNIALASVSKVFTAQAILKLVEQGRLKLDDRAFSWFRDMRPPEGMREVPRLEEITIRMCLQHTGGWNRKTSGDPSGWTARIQRALHIERAPTPFEMIRYMKGVPLDFNPGSQQAYSNFGFVLLGGVIAQLTKQDYPEFIQQFMLHPMGITGMRIEEPPPDYLPGEAHRYLLPSEHPLPGGNHRMMLAAGGWSASCVDMARLLTAIDGSRTGTNWLSPALMQAMVTPAPGIAPASPQHWMGLGWDEVEKYPPTEPGGAERYSWGKDGALGGIQTWVQHLAEGANFALLLNSPPQHNAGTPGGLAVIRSCVVDFIRGVRGWPAGDLFADFAGAEVR